MQNSIPILRTKVIAPRRREDILPRQRLLDLLSELMDLRLIIVAAPAGYGKTSLLVDFINETKMPACWFSLDSFDQDVQRFASHLVAAIKSRYEAFGRTSMAAIQSSGQEQVNIESLASMVANDLYENIGEHFILVLDDYHLVEESQPVTHLINQLIQRVDENCHFIVASRTLLNLPDMPLLVARSQVGGLSIEELAFQPDEIQDLWLRNFHINLSEGEAAELAQETEGWITGLLLNRQTAGAKKADRLRGARVAGVGLYEYLVQQVLERQSPAMQQFLLRTSLLEEFDADFCRTVIGEVLDEPVDWGGMIGHVLRANLFIQPIGEDHVYLRYHHLFRDFLQNRMLRMYPDEARRIQASLALTWAKRREWERSYRVYQQLNRPEDIVELIDQAGPDLIARGRVAILAEWLDNLPESLLQRPTIISLQGAVYITRGRNEDGLHLLDKAIHLFEGNGDRHNLVRTLTRRAVAHKLLGHYQQSLEDMQRACDLAETLQDAGAIRADALAGMGTAYFHEGNLSAALNWLNQAYQAFEALNDGESTAKTAMQIGVVTRALGQYAKAEQAYKRALDYYQTSGNLIWQANVLNNLGVLQHLRGAIEAAADSFDRAIQYARISGYARMEAYALTSIGDLYRDLDAPEEAQSAYHQARPIALRGNDRFLTFYLDLVEASLSRTLGQLDHAERLIDVAWQSASKSNSAFQINLCRLERASCAVQRRDFAPAIPDLEEALAYFEKEGHRTESLRTHFYLAAVRRAVADRQAAIDHLEKVYAASADDGSRNPVVVTGRALRFDLQAMERDPQFARMASAILRQVTEFDRRIPSLRRLLRRQSQTIPLGPPNLVIHTLGRIQVKVNGRPVTNAEWLTQTARDLFLLIVAQPDGMSKEEIGAMVWPDSSPAELKMRFKNTIYRLRRAAGKEAILFEDDIYRFNRALDYEEDTESFIRELDLAEAAPDIEKKVYHYRAALKIYRGDYLPELGEDWVLATRERLHRRYIEALLKLATLELERRSFEPALACVQRLLAEDRCLEEAHRLGMLVHAAMGNRAGVMRQFEECRQALAAEFNTQPSLQTQQLYQTLVQ